MSTPRVYDQAPTVLPVDSLFHAAPTGVREESPGESMRDAVPRNRALDLPTQPIAPLIPVQTETASERDREREEERSRSWLRPMDFLGEDDLPRTESEEREREDREEEVIDWGSLREIMATREMEAENLRDRERTDRDSGGNGVETDEAVFSIRDRTAEGISMAPVQGARDRQAEVETGGASPGTGLNERPRPAPVLQPAMRMAPVMGGGPSPMDFDAERTRERPRAAEFEAARPRFSDPGAPGSVGTSENRWAPREPVRVERPVRPSPSPVASGSIVPAARSEPAALPQLPTASPGAGPPRPSPAATGMDIRRFRPEEFTIRPNDPWSRP
ncbi:MAG: hypothetical protein JJU05_06350 [Verrucomicrobia bacterium]|nr:hypothetical protein [Verrucomicrobiota bacterium]MCH8525739.1 hypothetical protein [Kiritimatiellia bacterium]